MNLEALWRRALAQWLRWFHSLLMEAFGISTCSWGLDLLTPLSSEKMMENWLLQPINVRCHVKRWRCKAKLKIMGISECLISWHDCEYSLKFLNSHELEAVGTSTFFKCPWKAQVSKTAVCRMTGHQKIVNQVARWTWPAWVYNPFKFVNLFVGPFPVSRTGPSLPKWL